MKALKKVNKDRLTTTLDKDLVDSLIILCDKEGLKISFVVNEILKNVHQKGLLEDIQKLDNFLSKE